jgi:acyl-CoA reductase-like NAD-dependent aldehyde dehydrogenase
MKYPETRNYRGGKFTSDNIKKLDVNNPLNGEIISTVPLSGMPELDMTVAAAQSAFPEWSELTSKKRSEVFYNYRSILKKKP